MADIIIPKLREVIVRQEGTRVLVLEQGKVLLDLPWEWAIKIGKQMAAHGTSAGQLAQIDKTISDEAILIASGAPISFFTMGSVAQREAAKEAAWDSKFRRVPVTGMGGIRSGEQVGKPRLRKLPPKGEAK